METTAETCEEPDVSASVGAPETFDVQALAAQGVSGSTAITLALIGVASSGAVLKLIRDWLKGRRDLDDKRLDIEAKKIERYDEAQRRCAVDRLQLNVQISKLEKKLAEVSEAIQTAQPLSPSLVGFDPEGLESRVAVLEKKAAPVRRSRKGR